MKLEKEREGRKAVKKREERQFEKEREEREFQLKRERANQFEHKMNSKFDVICRSYISMNCNYST
jgi:hypothetical protein